jgi:spermidine synthase
MLLFLVGLLALLCQIVLLRELNVACYGVELVYAVALAGWMVAGGVGAAWRSPVPGTSSSRVAWLVAAAAVALPADVAFVRASRGLLGGVPGAYLPFERQLLAVALSLAPISFVLGLAFRRAADAASLHGRPLSSSYAIESLGAVAGSAAATLLLAAGVQTLTLAILVAAIVPAAVLLAPIGKPTLSALCLLALVLAVPLSPTLDLAMTRWTHPDAVETRDSPYARITATERGGQTALFADDVLVFESESAQQEELAHVAALAHPAPRRILLLGGTAERLEAELRRHRPAVVDPVEMDRVLFGLASRRLRLGSTPIFADPRDFLRRGDPYDLIVVAMPDPTSGQSNRFYTAEFFGACRRRLAPGGVLAFRLSMPENVVTPLLAMRTASILAAVRSAFAHVDAFQAGSALVLASDAALPDAPEILVDRMRARQLDTRLVTPAYLRYQFENDRRAGLASLSALPVPPNSDARPICYPFAMATWLAKFYPDLLRASPALVGPAADGQTIGRLSGPWLGTFSIPRDSILVAGGLFLVCLIAARPYARLRTTLLAALAGTAGMLLETAVILAYQARSGALYERIGLLLLAFMAGLAIGAWAIALSTRRAGGPAALRRFTAASLAGVAVTGAVAAWLIAAGIRIDLLSTGAVLLAGGAAVGAVFACAASASESGGDRAAGRLYGADLVGGAVGSLVASLVLAPVAGLVPTTAAAAGLGLLALLLV